MPTKLTERQFYCVKCRSKCTLPKDDICFIVFKNKQMYNGKVPALHSECPRCNTNVTKFVKHSTQKTMENKYGKC